MTVLRKVDEYILLSDEDKLEDKLEILLEKKVFRIPSAQKNTINSLKVSEVKNIEIIFDNNYLSFKAIIANMIQYKSLKNSFKIIPKTTNFIIGSNSSNDRGEVITIVK